MWIKLIEKIQLLITAIIINISTTIVQQCSSISSRIKLWSVSIRIKIAPSLCSLPDFQAFFPKFLFIYFDSSWRVRHKRKGCIKCLIPSSCLSVCLYVKTAKPTSNIFTEFYILCISYNQSTR